MLLSEDLLFSLSETTPKATRLHNDMCNNKKKVCNPSVVNYIYRRDEVQNERTVQYA